ncbi:hypothetical protein D2T29_12290 [Sinirhodobacter populi]|uniref:DNA methylase adenine-specific domain-containing protein n=1 Tax=Paenirhodobacter populi TaxID=2306993 RepID=A0A443KCI2_9RHOB|nr:N-6 DNA methylase [Sinirhodobacter populi]RWR30445.1 hypothetical protein D2T29_12290 [Sinirhodobacter populi]
MPARDVADFIRDLSAIDRSRRPVQVFHDFCRVAYCMIGRSAPAYEGTYERLSSMFDEVMSQYARRDDAEAAMGRLQARCMTAMYLGGRDFLGEVAAEIGALSANIGQFFTPFELSLLNADLLIGDAGAEIESKGYITVHEPAAGAGSMIVAVADSLSSRGIDPARTLWVDAVELNATAFHMAYIQMSMRHIPGRITHGDSLSCEVFEQALTPASVHFFERHGARTLANVLSLGFMRQAS